MNEMDKPLNEKSYKARVPGLAILICLVGGACSESPQFEPVPSFWSGIDFVNSIKETDSLNVLNFEYIYNGAGVGVGDFNNDGLQDLFFSGNQVPGRMYLNQGDLRFREVTQQTGIKTPHWSTGVALVDINHDGLLDIYLSTIHPYKTGKSPNQFFIHQGIDEKGIPLYKEKAVEIGLADLGYSTQAVFFDYDLDGDLDVYLLTNALEYFDRSLARIPARDGSGRSTDRLYRNEGLQKNGLPRFVDVSAQAGITIEGWGLGIGIEDFNHDGWPDVYCANDFLSNDLLWINNRDGTFSNRINDYVAHQSHNSMGMDIADVNNDGLPDIVNLDMMPADNLRQKTMFSRPGYDLYNTQLQRGYQPQFVRNTLQLNRGLRDENGPLFSEIGLYSGVYATDWSWSALCADFDNDGLQDLFITNGYRKDVTHLDFINYNPLPSFTFKREDRESRQERRNNMEELWGVKKPNVIFRNRDGLKFEDVTGKWGLDIPSYSNGAVYADLDNDGDLDIVVNNIDDEAFLFKNNMEKSSKENHFLRVKLLGEQQDVQGIGAQLTLYHNGQMQYRRNSPYRGYKSTPGPLLHFGLGTSASIDSLQVVWPRGKIQVLHNVSADQELILYEANARHGSRPVVKNEASVLLHPARPQGLNYLHTETDYIDFKKDHLLPHRHSQAGPGIAIGDIDGDELDDIVIGGSARQRAMIFYQRDSGAFQGVPFHDKVPEDTGLLLLDVDNDGDNDLYCVSGSSEHGRRKRHYQDRLYRNLGEGQFTLDTAALPVIESSGSCVTAADFDRDGDLDLFVGGYMRPGEYPMAPKSLLLENDGAGNFTNVVNTRAAGLERIGMVRSALWTDIDSDGWVDLLLVGEFMPIACYKNHQGQLKRYAERSFIGTTGWWNSLVSGDFDNDGDMDYVAGNLGLNSIYQASLDEPVSVYAKDFDKNGTIDPVLCRFIMGKEYPVHYRESMTDQMLTLKKIFTSYEDYGKLTFHEVFSPRVLQGAEVLRATQMASAYIENRGGEDLVITPLPVNAQFSPIYGMLSTDINDDGNLDLLAVGNSFAPDPLTGRYDASIGSCQLGDGKGNFTDLDYVHSGLLVKGDAKGAAIARLKGGRSLMLFTQNQDSLRVFEKKVAGNPLVFIPLKDDYFAEIYLKDGRKRRHEFQYGNTYLSQSSRSVTLPSGVDRIVVVNFFGDRREVHF